jgi:type IX secretion system PorP/SprF family membrane protein
MKNRKLFSALLIAFSSMSVVAQDIHFSQFNFAPLTLNPAQAGAQFDVRAIGNYRNQWSSIGKGYTTMGGAADMSLFKKPGRPAWMGLGLSVFNDKAGDSQMSTLMANLSLSGCVPVDKSIFSAGFQLGYNQKSFAPGALQWESQFNGFKYDATLPSYETYTSPNVSFMNTSAGVNWYYSKSEHYMSANDELKANVGLSVFHFNTPPQSFKNLGDEKLFSKIVFHGNFSIGLQNTSMVLVPSYIVYFQGPSRQYNGGLLLKYILTEASHFTHIKKACAISVGGFYRAGDAVIAQTVFEFDKYALGLSYDINTSRLKTASKSVGGFEINFRFNAFRAGASKSRI